MAFLTKECAYCGRKLPEGKVLFCFYQEGEELDPHTQVGELKNSGRFCSWEHMMAWLRHEESRRSEDIEQKWRIEE